MIRIEITLLRADRSFDGRATIFDAIDGTPLKNILSPLGAHGAVAAAKAYAADKSLEIVEIVDRASLDGRHAA